MKRQPFAIAVTLFVLLLSVGCGLAQDNDIDHFDGDEWEESVRKQPGFWHRPARETAAAQLAYADALRTEGRLRKAGRAYRALVHQWHDTPEAVKAQLAYAEILEARGKYAASFAEYQYLIDFFSGQFDYADVLSHQFRIANEVVNRRYGGFFIFPGFKAPERALSLYEQIAKNAPSWTRAPEVQYYIGWIHEMDKDYEAAISAYETLRQRWPQHELAVTAALGGTRCLVHLADKNKRDEVACRRALEALAGFVRDYADDPHANAIAEERDRLSARLSTMHYERAAYYDYIAQRPKSALIAYADFLRQFPYAEQAEAVNARVRELEAQIGSSEDSE